MPALSALEITHSRSVPAKNHVHCVEVRSTTFSCASQGKRNKVQTLPVKIRLYQHLEKKKIDKLTIVLMLNQQVMLQEELALLSIPSSRQRCVRGKNVTIFCNGGSNTTYITHQAADRIKAKKLNRFTLDVTTMGNVEKTYNTRQYQFTLRMDTGKKVSITAFGKDRITGPVSKLDTKVLANLFPGYDVDSLQRKTNKVDILLGCDYLGLFPKCEEAKCFKHHERRLWSLSSRYPS